PFFKYTVVKDPVGECSCPNPFPNFGGQDIMFPANRLRTTYAEPNPKRNYVIQWNLNVQQQLTPSLAAMVAYVGSRGVHQPFRVDEADLVIPTKTPNGYLWPKVDALGNVFSPICNSTDINGPPDPSSCAPPSTINPNYGSIRALFYEGHSYYN